MSGDVLALGACLSVRCRAGASVCLDSEQHRQRSSAARQLTPGLQPSMGTGEGHAIGGRPHHYAAVKGCNQTK